MTEMIEKNQLIAAGFLRDQRDLHARLQELLSLLLAGLAHQLLENLKMSQNQRNPNWLINHYLSIINKISYQTIKTKMPNPLTHTLTPNP
jgi:hypothetical protein